MFKATTSLGIPIAKDPLSDFRKFLFVIWKHLNLPDPTPVQYDIAYNLQHGDKRMIIQAFRGVGKSWITSAYVVWLLYMNPQLNILVVSASKSRSDDFTTFTLRLISEMDILAHLRPKTDQRQSKISFDVAPASASHAPSVKSVGISGQLAGSRADVIVADDIEVPNNSMTQGMRDKLSEAVKEFDAILKPDGRIIYLGTPQNQESLYNKLPDRGYKVSIWPARYPNADQTVGYGHKLARLILNAMAADDTIVGEPTDPARFSDFDLLEREASYGRSGFALQFMLDTRLSDAERYPLKVSDLIIMDIPTQEAPEKVSWSSDSQYIVEELPNVAFNGDHYHKPMFMSPEFVEYTSSVMSIDPSGRGKDETGYAVVKMLNGYLYVRRCGGIAGGYSEEALQKLAVIAKEEQVNEIIVESNFGDGMFNQLFMPVLNKVHPVTMSEVRHNKQKERRIIDVLEPVMNQHRLVMDKKVIQKDFDSCQHLPPEQALRYQLMYQLTRLTADRGALTNDDRLDALAMACQYWVDAMAQDVEQRMGVRREEMMVLELDRLRAAASMGYAVIT
ncbi:MAG: phage terminase large subunit, partial [Planktomarina sp.]|uniref:phage terminase large subunit n=1 Tax=Planktomarina sp. TaxID=2024851 RepID=UPI00325FF0CD|nr:phage terminase large subunit [Planktomarina sp.]